MREKCLTAVEGSRRASASHGMRSAPSTVSGDRCDLLPVEGPVQKACTADECCFPPSAQESSAPRHRRGRVGGRALRRSLCAHGTRSMSEVSLRVWRHACTHDSLTHHTARTACQAHVLAGAGSAVQHLESRKLWLDKSWTVAVGGGASRGAMACHETPCATRESASCMAPRMASCEHELFWVVFACAWWVVDVAYGSGAVRASTGVGAAAGMGSVAVLARF